MPPRLPLGSHPLLVCLLLAAPLHGQSPGEQAELQARYDAHQADFDYLLGDWEFVQTRPTPDGPVEFRGFWSAARSADGALITDEFRIVDDSGGTSYVGTTVRAYSPSEQRWNLVSVEPGWGVVHTGVARKEGDEIQVERDLRLHTVAHPLLRHPAGPLLMAGRHHAGWRQDLDREPPAHRGPADCGAAAADRDDPAGPLRETARAAHQPRPPASQ